MSRVRTPGARLAGRVVGLAVAVVATAWGGLSLASQMARETTIISIALPDRISRFEITDVPGDISIDGGSQDAPRLVQSVHSALTMPDQSIRTDRDTLRYRADCTWFDERCGVDLQAFIDGRLPVTASAGGGDLRVRGVTGDLVLTSTAGDVTVTDSAGDMFLESSAGAIQVSRSRSDRITATSSAGDVRLDLATDATEITADSAAGDVEIVVPGQVAYRVEADSAAGNTRIEVPTDPNASRVIRISSAAGDVVIRTRPA
jgi:hypothetical protein